MEMDPDICGWIFHFLARKRNIRCSLINALISTFPLSDDDFPLKKLLLLVSILSQVDKASITETTLDFLETLECLDSLMGVPSLPSLVEAYRAVAVESTVQHLFGNLDSEKCNYLDSVRRIWRGKVRWMEEEAARPDGRRSSLLTNELLQWRNRLEAALHDQSERQRLLAINTRADAFASVRLFLEQAWEGLDPPFIEILAKQNNSSGRDLPRSSSDSDGRFEIQHSSSSNLPRHSIMERNSTAHSYEWDESEDSMEEPSRRRQMRRWTELEEDTLRAGVERFGRGNWKDILESYPDVFEGRTYVDLKDKWRNMVGH